MILLRVFVCRSHIRIHPWPYNIHNLIFASTGMWPSATTKIRSEVNEINKDFYSRFVSFWSIDLIGECSNFECSSAHFLVEFYIRSNAVADIWCRNLNSKRIKSIKFSWCSMMFQIRSWFGCNFFLANRSSIERKRDRHIHLLISCESGAFAIHQFYVFDESNDTSHARPCVCVSVYEWFRMCILLVRRSTFLLMNFVIIMILQNCSRSMPCYLL